MCKKIRHWLWRWLYRQRWIFFMLALVGVTVFFGFRNSDFRSAFLFDRYGEFQWVSVTASFGGIGLFINANAKMQEIRANILSKNKLEMLNSFTEDVSEFSALIWQYNNILEPLVQSIGLDNFLGNHMNAVDEDNTDKSQILNKIREETDKLNNIHFKLKQKSIKIELVITEKNNQFASNVNNQISKLLNEIEKFLAMLNESSNDTITILKQYKIIIEENDLLVAYSVSYYYMAINEETKKLQMK